MKLRTILLATTIALPLATYADTLKNDARDAWDSTKRAAVRTGELVEDGAVHTGRVIERGARRTGEFVERSADRVATPRVTVTDSKIYTPMVVGAGSDIVVRNRSDIPERVQIRGEGISEKTYLKPGEMRRMDVGLQPGNYRVTASDGATGTLRVR